MLGDTSIPSSNLLQDDPLLMVLRYPQVFSLTKRVIRGEIRSLREEISLKYFDVVSISSLLGPYSKYHFSPGKLESRTCNQNLYRDELEENGVNFLSSELCKSLELFSGKASSAIPNWRLSTKGEDDVIKLTIQQLMCEQITTRDMNQSTRVAAVISTFPAKMENNPGATRARISEALLSVEETWDPSTGQLCMVGCPIISDPGSGGCDSQVSLYFPRTLSIRQRGALVGSISSSKGESDWYFPITFLFEVNSLKAFHDYKKYVISYQTYNYTMTSMANAFRKQHQPSKLSIVARKFFTYPELRDLNDLFFSLDRLSRALAINAYAVSEASYDRIKPEIFVNVEVLSLGPLLGNYVDDFCDANCIMKRPAQISKSEFLNVSLSLSFTEVHFKSTEKYFKNISSLFLEGVYDSHLGEMYLIGCRKFPAKTGNFTAGRGLDCLIQVKIQYSAENIRWLINPTAKITIISQRNEDDSLFFHPLNLQTFMIMYSNHDDALFRKDFEENLRIFLLLCSIILISSQLLYLRKNKDAAAYVSYRMLTTQLVVYAVPVLLLNIRFAFEPKEDRTRFLQSSFSLSEFLLTSAASLLIIRLRNMVANSGNVLQVDSPRISKLMSNNKKIMIITVILELAGYETYFRYQDKLLISKAKDFRDCLDIEGVSKYKHNRFLGLIQDTFLIPQIICNLIWKPPGKQPLRKLYYIGLTLMRILIHLYDYIRDPVIHPYSYGSNVNERSVFTSRTEKIAITAILSALAIIVYLQQKTKHQKVNKLPLLSSKSSD